MLPKPINQFARMQGAHHAPLSVVRWLLQQGMNFDFKMLREAAHAGRVDILQLAHSMRVPITADMIAEAALNSKWEVLVWASRNGVPIDYAHIQHQLLLQSRKFIYPEQRAELLHLLRHVYKHEPPAAAAAAPEEDADGTGGANLAQKRRKSKR